MFPVVKEELVELVLCQRSSPSGSSSPESPNEEPIALTTEPPGVNSILTDPSTPSLIPEPGAALPEAPILPPDITSIEHDVQDKDQVKPFWKMCKIIAKKKVLEIRGLL